MDNIYGSVESFDSQLFRTEECRAKLLSRNRTEYLLDNIKLKFDDCVRCHRCKRLMDSETTLPVSGAEDGCKRASQIYNSDDLQVMPPFTSTSSSLVKNLGFTGWNSFEAAYVLISIKDAFETLLKHEPLPELSNENVDQEIDVESRMLGDATNE
ncbi:hypothetical protein CerSpe_010160 [Prunus speciosa]